MWTQDKPNYTACLLLTTSCLVHFGNVWLCTSLVAILVCLLVPSLMMFPSLTASFLRDGEGRGESSAVAGGANCAPFIIRWHPGTQRGQGKESRGNTSDLRWGGGVAPGVRGIIREAGERGQLSGWPWGWWSALPAGCGGLGSNGEGEPGSPADPLEPNAVVFSRERWEAEVRRKIKLIFPVYGVIHLHFMAQGRTGSAGQWGTGVEAVIVQCFFCCCCLP